MKAYSIAASANGSPIIRPSNTDQNAGVGFYVGDEGQTTNAAENFFGNFKRSMKGTYRFCSKNISNVT
jgi:hypothetical protein